MRCVQIRLASQCPVFLVGAVEVHLHAGHCRQLRQCVRHTPYFLRCAGDAGNNGHVIAHQSLVKYLREFLISGVLHPHAVQQPRGRLPQPGRLRATPGLDGHRACHQPAQTVQVDIVRIGGAEAHRARRVQQRRMQRHAAHCDVIHERSPHPSGIPVRLRRLFCTARRRRLSAWGSRSRSTRRCRRPCVPPETHSPPRRFVQPTAAP